MKFIGITGGVGSGKSTVLDVIEDKLNAKVYRADDIAKDLMLPGTECYDRIVSVFGDENIFARGKAKRFDEKRLAELIFSDDVKREKINAIVHPAVKEYILSEVSKERALGRRDYVFFEAALLIEGGYGELCDELWYVYTPEEVRRERLKNTRGYTDEKIDGIFASQLDDAEYRRHCVRVIDNSGDRDKLSLQILGAIKGGRNVMDTRGKDMVFGLDIGTRNVVGTVGYRDQEDHFVAMDICCVQHDTRAMLDGQIHDIGKVGNTIRRVKETLEDRLEIKLNEVCIAAAGRVLKTVTTTVEYELPEETVITGEDVHTLDLLGIEKAQGILKETNDTHYKFYVVGYSTVKYYLGGDIYSNLIGHKGKQMSEDIIVTFLPWDVVDGLYAAVGMADLTVANLTLEPIAAINVAIPQNFRMLNIGLVDVGAGTSDICITRDGSIIAYGMIPHAGDEITEIIVQHYLVDFAMAEHIKLASTTDAEVTFEDIMSISHTVPSTEVWELIGPTVDKIATEVAGRIKELNGDKSVSACFVVGGGGKVHGFTEKLAEELALPKERVALRGEEVLKQVTFLSDEVKKDPLVVTPIGICLNYYEQRNNFIMVRFNGERIKLFDNNHLTIVDAAIAADFPNENLFPRRGKAINFTVNGVARMVRGTMGESAVVYMNDEEVNINTHLEPNAEIKIVPSTAGSDAEYTIDRLPEFNQSTISFVVNNKTVTCPRFVEVNGEVVTAGYALQDGDVVVVKNYYTVAELAEFMDVELDPDAEIIVNNKIEDQNTQVYENFTVELAILSYRSTKEDVAVPENDGDMRPDFLKDKEETDSQAMQIIQGIEPVFEEGEPGLVPKGTGYNRDEVVRENTGKSVSGANAASDSNTDGSSKTETAGNEQDQQTGSDFTGTLKVIVNGDQIEMKGKTDYTFIDIFDYIDFDISDSRGRGIITTINGIDASYTQQLFDGDRIEIRWQEKMR